MVLTRQARQGFQAHHYWLLDLGWRVGGESHADVQHHPCSRTSTAGIIKNVHGHCQHPLGAKSPLVENH